MEGMHHMNRENLQPDEHSWPTRTNSVSTVALISSEQVWISLSGAQQETVAATVVRICQTLARQSAQPSQEEEAHERRC